MILALGIPVGITIASTSADAINRLLVNLPADVALVNVNVRMGTSLRGESIMPSKDFDVASVTSELSALAAAIPGAQMIPVFAAADPTAEDRDVTYSSGESVKERSILRASRPNGPLGPDGNRDFSFAFVPVWVATPDLLGAFHLDDRLAGSAADLLGPLDSSVLTGDPRSPAPPPALAIEPLGLDRFGSIPPYWVSPAWVAAHHFEPTINGWMVVAPTPITTAQRSALQVAAGSKLTVETRVEQDSSASIRRSVLIVGGAVASAILAVVVSLIRSEASDEQYTLAAVGAPRRARRSISAATAGLLAGTAGLLAVPTGYLALIGLMSNRGAKQGFVLPLDVLAAVLIVFPLLATRRRLARHSQRPRPLHPPDPVSFPGQFLDFMISRLRSLC